ncbi:MAG: galactose-1-phosphate uridylyltransferase [Elusimicrobiota bacterium]|nr:galactose-1-phosphate uridylyltransferase [Elusimicrobiota bacterium]
MPEIRQNIATREWVIISPERAKRPEDFVKKKSKAVLPEYSNTCPFCPENEHLAPVETFSIKDNSGRWLIRAIPNKYAALKPEGECTYFHRGIVRHMTGFGYHEVIVESPKHNLTTAVMSEEQIVKILQAYKARYLSVISDDRIELVTIFKNHGPLAGASIEHPHSQLIASPVVPQHIRNRIEEAMRYYDDNRECVFCRMIREEIEFAERIIQETENFVAFIPYAALSPFHIWILPKMHIASFPTITDNELDEFAKLLKNILSKIYHGLDDPDYNYIIQSLPGKPRENDFFHWYLSIIPRVTKTAGFELGSGMYINTAMPEESARFLREMEV